MSQELIRCFSKTAHVLFAYTRQRNYNMVHHFEFGLEQTRGGRTASGNRNKSLILLYCSVAQLLSCRLPQQTHSLAVASETLPGNAPDYG